MNATTEGPAVPPQHLLGDYIEILYLCLIIAIGTPLNLYVFVKLLKEKRQTANHSIKAGFVLMKISLNLSDLLLLLGYCLGKVAWLSTYSWEGGDLLCKLYMFITFVALYLSSNVVVCIAIDRFKNVISVTKLHRDALTPVRVMLILAWSLAIICALPQLVLWHEVDVFPNWPGGWHQCIPIYDRATDESAIYNIIHLSLVFWLPLLLLFICYIIIAARLLHYSMRPATETHIVITRDDDPSPKPSTSCALLTPTGDKSKSFTNGDVGYMEFASTITNHGVQYSVAELDHDGSISVSALPNETPIQPTMRNRLMKYLLRQSHPLPHHKEADYLTEGKSTSTTTTSSKRRPQLSVTKSDDPTKRARVPAWRKQLRSRVFKTTILIVVTHVLFWLPYNLIALSSYVGVFPQSDAIDTINNKTVSKGFELYKFFSDNMNIFKDLQILIALLNPFLYGINQG